jgi:hypothetical protein
MKSPRPGQPRRRARLAALAGAAMDTDRTSHSVGTVTAAPAACAGSPAGRAAPTTSPDGEPVAVEQRLAEIHDQYGQGHLVSRSIQRATPMILLAVEQVHHRSARIA